MKMLFKGNSSRLELLIEKIQSTRESSDVKEVDTITSMPGTSKNLISLEPLAGPSRINTPVAFPLRCAEMPSSSPAHSETEDFNTPTLSEQTADDDDLDDSHLTCSICNEDFSKRKQLVEHEQIHADNLHYTCLYCPRLFKHKRSRDRHTKLHTGDKKYKCSQCDSAFSRSDHLKIHMKTHDNRKPYKCSVCSRGYNTATALSSHQHNHLKKESSGNQSNSEDSIGLDLFKCNYCTESFNTFDILQNHLILVHSEPNSPTSQSSDYQDVKTFCIYCSKDFATFEQMYDHMSKAHKEIQTTQAKIEESSFSCDRCSIEFDSMQNLKDHIYNDHWRTDQKFATDLSKKKKLILDDDDLVNENNNKKPKSTHNEYENANDKPFICSCCYAQLPNFKSFLLHMETHMTSTNNLFACIFCGESNRDPVSFTNHMFSHVISQIPDNYCCCNCEKSFDHYDKLQKHLIDVHVLTIYKCTICNELFDSKNSMKVHLNNKHANDCQHFKCHLCVNQEFHDRLSAEIHISMKHFQHFAACATRNLDYTGVLLNCHFCQKTFKDQYSQYLHLLKDHKEKQGKYLVMDSLNSCYQTPSTLSPKSLYQNILQCHDQIIKEMDHEELNRYGDSNFLVSQDKLLKSKGGNMSLQCAYCNEYCKSKNDLQNHVKSHQIHCGKVKHKCNICDEIFQSALTLADHKLKHCKIIDGNNCVQCKTILVDEQAFYNHQLTHSNVGLVKNNTQIALPAICIVCSQTLQTDVEIKLHAKFHLKYLLQQKDQQHCNGCSKIIDFGDSECADCSSNLLNLTDTKDYVRLQYNPNDFAQPSKKLDTKISLECQLCKQIFETQIKLQVHLIEHNFYGMNQYSCYVCSSVFTAASGLQTHMLEHNIDSKPYECPNCHLTFFFRAELDNHRFVHVAQEMIDTNGEVKPCPYCAAVFLHDNFNDHLKQCPYKVSPKTELCDSDNNTLEDSKCSLELK